MEHDKYTPFYVGDLEASSFEFEERSKDIDAESHHTRGCGYQCGGCNEHGTGIMGFGEELSELQKMDLLDTQSCSVCSCTAPEMIPVVPGSCGQAEYDCAI